MKRHAPATSRNREPILDVLRVELARAHSVLEIASGTGEHAAFFARALPHLVWQPTDTDASALASIDAHRADAGAPNLLAASRLDVLDAGAWTSPADAIVCINMIHIAPWEAALALFELGARLLAPGAPLVLYGPFRFGGAFLAPSNAAFDESLRARDPRWGVRDLDDVTAAASRAGFDAPRTTPLPANNHTVVFPRRSIESF